MTSADARPRLASPAGRGRPLRAVPAQATPAQITSLRAEAQIAALDVRKWPAYGSGDWLRLDPADPRCYAAVLEAAELWRRMDADPDLPPAEWCAAVFGDARRLAAQVVAATNRIRTARQIRDARAQSKPPHVLRATRGWPPIAIPGKPGRYLVHGQETAQ